jgi:threonine dehydrogenase-like Zn-dependent dehydrogenase
MLAYTYISPGKFELIDKPKPELQGPRDAIVRITLGSICTSDLHIKLARVSMPIGGITVATTA